MSLLSRINLVKRLLESRKVRDAYVYEHVRNGIPFQIRALRKDRDWSQSELAEAAKTSRTVITRIEDPNYGKLTLKTLFSVASAFDVALLVKLVPFSRLLREYQDVSSEALSVPAISNEERTLQRWATANVAAYALSSRSIPIEQLTLAFAETKPSNAASTRLMPTRGDVQQSGSSSNVFSIRTKRPLSQRRKSSRFRKTA